MDSLTGGSGNDSFVLGARGSGNADTISDFASGDRIALDSVLLSELSGQVGSVLSADNFRVGSAATAALEYVVYDDTTGSLYYDADGDGTTYAPELLATVTGAPNLSASDFSVI